MVNNEIKDNNYNKFSSKKKIKILKVNTEEEKTEIKIKKIKKKNISPEKIAEQWKFEEIAQNL